MKKIIFHYKFSAKLIMANILLLVLPVLVTYSLISNNLRNSTIERENSNSKEYLYQMKSYIDKNIDICHRSTQILLSNRTFMQYFQMPNIDINDILNLKQTIVPNLHSLTLSTPQISAIRFYSDKDNIPETMPIIYSNKLLEDQLWHDELALDTDYWLIGHHDFVEVDDTPDDTLYVSMYNKATLPSGKYIGTVEIIMTLEEFLGNMYSSSEKSMPGYISDDGTIYSNLLTQNSFDGNPWGYYMGDISTAITTHPQQNSFEFKLDNKYPVLINYIQIPELKGYIFRISSLIPQYSDINETQRFFLISIIAFMIILSFAIKGIIGLLFKKLYHLTDVMRDFKLNEHDELTLPRESNDEVGELIGHFRKIIHKTKTLMDNNARKEVMAKNAEIKALQSQINAHFIYNTLENIRMMAELEYKYDISNALFSLGTLLRYSVKKNTTTVLLSEELKYIESYINLMNLRYDFEIHLSVNIPLLLMKQPISKLLLQPLIENSILHGIVPLAKDSTIYIKAYVVDNDYILEISDTGLGIPEERLTEINDKINGNSINDTDGKSIALQNIQERLHHIYGHEYSLTIASIEGCYTKASLRLPYTIKEMTK